MTLLDFYRSRFGQAVRHHGDGWNGPCPLCGGEPGKSDRFMIWPDRTERLGKTCAEHGIGGIWNCRQCGRSGDTIAYLMQIEGMDFRAALAELGINGLPRKSRLKAPTEPAAHQAWQPREFAQPSQQWQEHALKLVEKAEQAIWDQPQALAWLAARGITKAAIWTYRLGYLAAENEKYAGSFRPRKSFGLEPKTDQDGKTCHKLYIPRGIVIPTFGPDGSLLNLRIRRHKTDLKDGAPKYMELAGSWHGPLRLKPEASANLACYFITEAELDAMLIHFASGGKVGAIAVRTNRGKPDSLCHPVLQASARICIALDFDAAGLEGVDFWEETYPQAIRWPTPEGKDPGDAFGMGVNIREWINLGLPASARLPETPVFTVPEQPESGHVDLLPSGQDVMEARGVNNHEDDCPAKTDQEPQFAQESDFGPEELALLKTEMAAGGDLELVYLDVARAWLLWRDVAVTFRKSRSANGVIEGYAWDWSYTWEAGHREEFNRFWRFQRDSEALRQWLFAHPADEITAKNLLKC